MIQCTTN